MADYFGITQAVGDARNALLLHDPIIQFKKNVVLKRVKHCVKSADASAPWLPAHAWLCDALNAAGFQVSSEASSDAHDWESMVAQLGVRWLADADRYEDDLARLIDWCVRAVTDPQGQAFVASWVGLR